jgi:hypothetical protein
MSTKHERPGFHVIVAATSPFTTITLDESDAFKTTLDEINTNTYDRLKICRTTLAVNGYLPALTANGIGVIVSYTGAFLFPRMKGITKADVISSTNQVLLRLMFGGIKFDSVAPEDVGFGTIYMTGYYLAGGGGASGANFSLLQDLQHQTASNLKTILLMRPRTFTKKEFYRAIEIGTPIVASIPELNASIFLDGVTHYEQFRLASALVFLWSSIESVVGKIWSEKMVPKGSGIQGRKDFIKSSAWQAAHKIEVLFQAQLIDETLYGKLNEARTARNALAHRGDTPNLKACEQALDAVFSLISLVVTDFSNTDEFAALVDGFKVAHRPHIGPLNPEYWREIPSVPGDEKWGEAPYPRHSEIELKPIASSKRK